MYTASIFLAALAIAALASPFALPTKAGCEFVETLLEPLCDRRARDLGVLAFVPDDRQFVQRRLGVPPGIGNDGDRVVTDRHDFLDALHGGDFGRVIAFQLAAKYRAGLDRGIEHAGQFDVDAIGHFSGGLVDGVEALDAFAGELPVFRVFQLDVGRRLDLGGGFGDLAIGGRASRRRVGDDAVGGGAFRRRHLPFIGRGLDQHDARGRATLADVFLGGADAATAAGREIAPDALAGNALSRRRVFGGDLRPVAFEFFGDQLREAGQRPLAHFRSGDADDDGVVGLDHDPGVDFGRAIGGAHHGRAAKGNIEAEREAGADSGGADHKSAAVEGGHMIHDHLLKRSRRRELLHAPV